MNGLLATKGTMPSSSYAKTLRPPIQTSTTTRPMRVTVMPTRSRRAASSNNLSIERLSSSQSVLGNWRPPSQLPQERHQILLLFLRQIQLQDEVEELDGVLQGQATAVVHIRRT